MVFTEKTLSLHIKLFQMKLKFTIHYRTQWGEALMVAIDFRCSDGTSKHQELLMQTQDGDFWHAETAAVASRQHPFSAITYIYKVVDGDGKTLRQEWAQVPRCYYYDAAADYTFPDQWRDRPLPFHLYSNAYLISRQMSYNEVVEVLPLPRFRKTIVFRLSAPQLQQGQQVAVIGSHPALGSWNPARYLPMHYAGQHEWLLSLNADAMQMPLEYKFVVVDQNAHQLIAWEEGDNRLVADELKDGEVRVLYGDPLRLCEPAWRAAGVVVPVFALRSEHSCGVGDFGDLRLLVDWAVRTGMKIIQLLPLNDTTTNHRWGDSYPYNIVSAFALHPHYLDLEQLGPLKDKQRMTAFRRQQRELNALAYSDYEAVDRVKSSYIDEVFAERGAALLATKAFKDWLAANDAWLPAYAKWLGGDAEKTFFVQYHLHQQLKAAADYAREKGVVLKGDLPIGVHRDSVDIQQYPQLFNLDSTAGAPPDGSSMMGYNWGIPTYRWSDELVAWFRRRMKHMEQYFDALRVDHILGFFRIWEIPDHAISSLLGHFSPALPLTVDEIEYFGLPFRKELYTRPFINDRQLDRLFGVHAQYVRDHFLVSKAYNLYDLKDDFNTQRKVAAYFGDRRDENSLWIRDGLMRLISNVLFVEDSRQPDMYHPRIGVINEPVFDVLSSEEKDAFVRLYNNYFYQRHSFFWGQQALKRLPAVMKESRMLLCAEDLGMLPDCVEPVLDQLRVLTLEIQQQPKQHGFEYAHLEANPIRSVCTISTHDMPTLRQWWAEDEERTQDYFNTMLYRSGNAPHPLPSWLAKDIVSRHLTSPSMLCLLSLQDWLSIDERLRLPDQNAERINIPANPRHYWRYRMHLTIEELMQADNFNEEIKTLIKQSGRK
jgi:4-alpha-glucanotransferase